MTISPIGKGNRRGGFTVLETLVVLIIISVCCIISIPLFSRFMKSAKLDMAARNVASVLRTARSHAITNNSDCYVVFDTGVIPNEYFDSWDGVGPIEKKYKLSGGIWFYKPGASNPTASLAEAIEFGGDIACFKPNGQLDEAQSRSVYIADGQTAGANYIDLTVEKTTGSVDID